MDKAEQPGIQVWAGKELKVHLAVHGALAESWKTAVQSPQAAKLLLTPRLEMEFLPLRTVQPLRHLWE